MAKFITSTSFVTASFKVYCDEYATFYEFAVFRAFKPGRFPEFPRIERVKKSLVSKSDSRSPIAYALEHFIIPSTSASAVGTCGNEQGEDK